MSETLPTHPNVCRLCGLGNAVIEAPGGAPVCEGCVMLGRLMGRLIDAMSGWSAADIAEGVRLVVERDFAEHLGVSPRPRECFKCGEPFVAPGFGHPDEAGEAVLCTGCVNT